MKKNLEIQLSTFSETELQLLLKTSKCSNQLFGKTIKDLIFFPYELVKIELPELFKNNDFSKIILLFFKDKTQSEINNLKTSELFSFIVWLIDQLEAIYKLENDYLTQTPDMDLIKAGVSELDQFGELNIIDNLAGGDILKWKKIKKLPYHIIFDKLHKNVVEAKIQKAYNRICQANQLRIKN